MQFFRRLTLSTLIAVYVLILVGGVVRSTGSGMGCPDWPKCFGQWTPPTSVEQLPADYKAKYSEYRQKKSERFAKYLKALGFTETATAIINDKTIREEADFNPLKTWIEYLNRIVGAIIGFLIFGVFVASLHFWKEHKHLTLISFATFILVGFQGWIGSVVVSTNLMPWVITFHMFLAILVVALLIYLLDAITPQQIEVGAQAPPRLLVAVCLGLLAIQILLGTQVREAMDRVAEQIQDRGGWVQALGIDFVIHRSFSWVVLVVHSFLVVKLWKMRSVQRFSLGVILLILGTLFTGIGMAWFSVPPYLQPVHLVLATAAFGVEFFLVLQLSKREVEII